MSKIVILGIDGLDPFLLKKWKKELPNFASIIDQGSDISLDSTFPPDSICAWTSIFTGTNPAEHGLIESIDYLSSKKISGSDERSSRFKGRTFWDIAGNEGKRVCVINPFLAYPSWQVNGVMVSGPVFEGGNISAFPEDIISQYPFPPLGGIVDFPEQKQLGEFLKTTRDVTEQLADVSLELYQNYGPDLFFTTFLTLDRVKHFLWRFTDEEDMYYPGENEYKNSVKQFYMQFDAIVGHFIERMDQETILCIISDHGHRRRCSKCLNLNEILRKKGYLKTNTGGISGSLKKIVERAKVFILSTLSRTGLQDWIYRIAKFVPGRKALKKSTYLINKDSSPVTLSNICGTNPYGGLDIRGATIEEYERLRETLIEELRGLNDLLGLEVVKWVGKREETYSGKYIERLPDVLFELHGDYGVGMDLYTPFVTENFTHKKISGGHKREAVFLAMGDNAKINQVKRPHSIIDVNRFILEVLSIAS